MPFKSGGKDRGNGRDKKTKAEVRCCPVEKKEEKKNRVKI